MRNRSMTATFCPGTIVPDEAGSFAPGWATLWLTPHMAIAPITNAPIYRIRDVTAMASCVNGQQNRSKCIVHQLVENSSFSQGYAALKNTDETSSGIY